MNNIFKRIITSFFLILLLIFGLYYNDITWKVLVIFFLLLCFYEFYFLLIKVCKIKIISLIFLFLIGLYLYLFYFLLIKIKLQYNEEIILILLVSCIFSDIGGYVIGKLFGGPKLTDISPNKTISGALGSLIFTVAGTSFFVIFLKKINKDIIIFEFSIIFVFWLILMSIYCQLGDLFISYLKRKAKIKDTGNILPGHGGVLDRVDGILLAIPFGVLSYLILLSSI